MGNPSQKIVRYIGEHGMVRPRDIEAIGLPREYLVRLHRQGKLNRSGRGLYTVPDASVTERHSYAEVAKRVPETVVCLLSALAFHEITTSSERHHGSCGDWFSYHPAQQYPPDQCRGPGTQRFESCW
jgi:predicted transcriptional regulator of viral defense system